MRSARMLMAAAALVALVGCSSETPGPDGGNGGNTGQTDTTESIPDPCTVVTKEEAAEALAVPVADGLSERVSEPGLDGGRSCLYRAAPGQRGQLSLTIWAVDDALFNSKKNQEKQFGDVQDVPGVGDAAYRVGWTGLSVRQGKYLLEFGIELAKYHPDVAQDAMKKLAASSASRL